MCYISIFIDSITFHFYDSYSSFEGIDTNKEMTTVNKTIEARISISVKPLPLVILLIIRNHPLHTKSL